MIQLESLSVKLDIRSDKYGYKNYGLFELITSPFFATCKFAYKISVVRGENIHKDYYQR